jgi:hypothetical protein
MSPIVRRYSAWPPGRISTVTFSKAPLPLRGDAAAFCAGYFLSFVDRGTLQVARRWAKSVPNAAICRGVGVAPISLLFSEPIES